MIKLLYHQGKMRPTTRTLLQVVEVPDVCPDKNITPITALSMH